VSRWDPDARERLERAALELFVEQGFANTTVPQITARAGLTTRTFFRHFADKREVLFAYEEDLPARIATLMAGAPASDGPMALIASGLEVIAESQFEGRLARLRTHRSVVQSDEGLQERELRKQSVLSEAIRAGFRHRGLDDLTSTLAAHLAVTVFGVAIIRWLDQPGSESPDYERLSVFIQEALSALESVATERR
jgi:AcrR family transcriptional regulator